MDRQPQTESEGRSGPKREGMNSAIRSKLYNAAIRGDWKTAESIIKVIPDALTARIGPQSELALHVAAKTGHSVKFVQELVNKMPADSLEITDFYGSTALHLAACAGNTDVAKILVHKNSILPQRINRYGDTALHKAVYYGHEETVLYLLSKTEEAEPSLFAAQTGVKLLNSLIIADLFDVALYLLKRYPTLAKERNQYGKTAFETLATTHHAFESRRQLGRVQGLIYHCTGVHNKDYPSPRGDIENYLASDQSPEKYPKRCRFIQHILNTRLMHKQAMELLGILIDKSDPEDVSAATLFEAVELGNSEIVVEAIKTYPYLVGLKNDKGEDVFHVAVVHRQEKIYNLLYQMSSQKNIVVSVVDKRGNNLLHKAGQLGSSDKISGAALQMQRELQWFKEVEKTVQPLYKEMKNQEGKTPRRIFTENHKDLMKEGEKWMRNTASSFTLVAALVVTVVFATAFTIPGGNNSDGIPIYVNQTSFLVFAASDILALVSSITSLLMFLGILTSRYAERDFLMALPMRLCIGLIALFFSIAAMLVAFSASFCIVLASRGGRIEVPIGVLVSVPVTLFAILQLPLLVEIVAATFGPSIFGKQSNEIIARLV